VNRLIVLIMILVAPFSGLSQQQKKIKLELPDVLIYGRDVEERQTGEKLSPTPDLPQLRELTLWSTYRSPMEVRWEGKYLPVSRKQKKAILTQFRTQYGSFNTLSLGARRWQRGEHLSYGFDLGYRRSDGQYENTGYSISDFQGQVVFSPYMAVKFSLKANYYRKKYGFYGKEGRGRTVPVKGLSGQLLVKPADFIRGRIDFQMKRFSLVDEPSQDELNEEILHFKGEITSSFSGLQLKVGADFLKDSYKPTGTVRERNTVVSAHLLLLWSITERFSLEVGPRFESLVGENWGRRERFSPDFRIVFHPWGNLGFCARCTQGYNYRNYYQLWITNNFVARSLDLSPGDRGLAIEAKMSYQPVEGLLFGAGFSQQKIRNYPYWADTLGLFQRQRIPHAQLTDITLQLRLIPSTRFHTEIRALLSSDAGLEDSLNVPYRPKISLPVSMYYDLGRDLKVRISAEFVGTRFADLYGGKKLDEYLLLNLVLEKKIGKHLSFSLRGENLTNDRYYLWKGYPEMGTYVSGNLGFKW